MTRLGNFLKKFLAAKGLLMNLVTIGDILENSSFQVIIAVASFLREFWLIFSLTSDHTDNDGGLCKKD